MSDKKAALLHILTALFFALMIIIVNQFTLGSENNDTYTYLILSIWFIPFSMITAKHESLKKCRN